MTSALSAFAFTLAIAVPAGWHGLDADLQASGPDLRPQRQTVQIGDASVAFDIDRGVMLDGKTVSAVLVATSPRPHDVTVDLTALENMGWGEERVPNPPRQVGQRTLKLRAEPGGGRPVVASFALGGHTHTRGRTSWYDLRVSDHARHGGHDDDSEAAVASVVTWGGNQFGIAIEPPAELPDSGPFTVAVRIKNTTRTPLGGVDVSLGSRFGMPDLASDAQLSDGEGYKVEQVEDSREREADSETDPTVVAPGAEKVIIYRVTPIDERRHLTFAVLATGGSDRVRYGAMEATSFDLPQNAPGDVAGSQIPVASR